MPVGSERPRAIAMWDFSWLERRWPGAGYEDWDTALAELVERGYDTVRIDAYPHLLAAGGNEPRLLRPQWNQQSWGAQSTVEVRPMPAVVDFIRRASAHGVGVALSTWFRQDATDLRMALTTPAALAAIWIDALDQLRAAGVLDSIVYVDLCNEFPMPVWAPFLYGSDEGAGLDVGDPRVTTWTTESIDLVRAAHPDLDLTFSFAASVAAMCSADVRTFDLLEPHIWMAGASDYYELVGYDYERFDSVGYDNLVARGKRVYEADQDRFDAALFAEIDLAAAWSRETGKPLVTTECWSVVDYKDWPGLDWDWVKDLNSRAVERAAATGRWVALATSNFCGPQFIGNWRDIAYHRRLTDLIRSARIDPDLLTDRG